jgi:hypothetical protein
MFGPKAPTLAVKTPPYPQRPAAEPGNGSVQRADGTEMGHRKVKFMTVTPNEVRELVLHAAGHCNQTATADRRGILDPNLRAEYLHDALMCARPGVPASKYAAAVDAALAQAKAAQGS